MKRTLTLLVAAMMTGLTGFSQLSLTTAGSPQVIDFSTSVSGVNNGVFDAQATSGATSPAAGQLDLDAWDMLVDGTPTAAQTTPATYPGTLAAGNGINTGGTTTTGFNAAYISGNVALGFQPSGSNFTAGSITLRVQNNTGVTLNEFAVLFDASVFNDMDRENSISLYYSTDNSTYTSQTGATVNSPAALDAAPVWVTTPVSTTITGVTVANGDFIYLRWVLDDVSGSGTRDEFALDNISVSGNVASGIEVNLSVSATSGTEAAADMVTLTVTALSAVPSNQTVDVVVTGTDVSASDYTLSTSTITILSGATTGTATFQIVDDQLNEGDLSAIITITNASSGIFIGSTNTATVDIIDNDDHLSITALNTPTAVINFNNIPDAGTGLNRKAQGSYLYEQGTNANTYFRADDGTSSTGDTYSFGSTTERSFGTITTGSLDPTSIGFKVMNNSGSSINQLTVSYRGEQWRSGGTSDDTLYFEVSTDATGLDNGTWMAIPALHFAAPDLSGSGALDGNLPANQQDFTQTFNNFGFIANGSEFWVRWTDFNVGGSDAALSVDDFSIEGALQPEITVTPMTLTPFNQVLGSPSAEQTLTASGLGLTTDITVTAPANYQVSLTSGSGFGSSVVLTHSAGIVAPTTVYVRLNSGSLGTSTGNIDFTSTGATTVSVPVTGNTTAAPVPTITVTPGTLTAFTQTVGTPSAEQTLSVSGVNLSADITVTAPTDFQVSLTAGTGFGSSVVLIQSSGTVSTTPVYVRFNRGSAGTSTGNVNATSTGASAVSVSVTGTATDPVVVLYINEFMASNATSVSDENGDFDDWIEIYNPNGFAVDLAGYHLSDDLATLNKYQIPTTSTVASIPAGGFLLIWADNEDTEGDLHTNFALSAGGEDVVLTAPDGTTIVDSYTFGAQTSDVSEGRQTDGNATWVFFTTPTPNATNFQGSVGVEEFSANDLFVYPVPVTSGNIHLSEKVDFVVLDINGRIIASHINTAVFNADALAPGLYVIRTSDNRSATIVKQ
jgi:hypothetical protein